MKKIFAFFLIFIIICFAIPLIFTKRNNESIVTKETEKKEQFDYKKYNKIKLLHLETNETQELELDEYLYGVVAAEMPANFHEEALKAQAVVARTYTVYKIKNGSKHEGADICDDANCCQAWISKENRFKKWNEGEQESNWEKIVFAVDNTKGQIITYNNEPINAFFHSNSGGTTETASNVWGGENYPYLQVVQTTGEEVYTQFNSEVVLTKEELIQKIREYHNNLEIDFAKEDAIKILEYTESGRVKKIKFGNLEIPGTEARIIFGLKSAMFTVEFQEENIVFKVIGYGHGVGMSQTGADSMAKEGYNYEDIIKHYYNGVEINRSFFE